MSDRPGFWSVLPAVVRYDPNLTPSAKLLYSEITALSNKQGYCSAGNAYFESLYDASPRTVRRLLSALEEKGYIRREVLTDPTNGATTERRIWPTWLWDTAGDGGGQKCPHPPAKNVPQNNTRINNTPYSPPGNIDRQVLEFCDGDPVLEAAFHGFLEMRAKRCKPVSTDRALSLLLTKLCRYAGEDRATMAELLDEATEHGWLSVYPPKTWPGVQPHGRVVEEEVIPSWDY